MHLTIAYFTNRPDPKIRWFFDSLHRETGGDYTGIKVVVVDFYAQNQRNVVLDFRKPGHVEAVSSSPEYRQAVLVPALSSQLSALNLAWIAPKPTVWQGPHRLTKEDYFCASNARNTAICHAPDGWIAFVDDLSILMPGWLAAVREAMAANVIVFGAYQKRKKMVVEDGKLVSSEEFPPGIDSRWNDGRAHHPVRAAGSWLFGCSLAAPVQAFLDINGFDEDCDSMGMEDVAAGMMLEKAGYTFRYDRRMLTYESEEDHAQLPVFKRIIKPWRLGLHKDASHAYLHMLQHGRNRAPNYFGPEGLAGLRQRILAGEPFPIVQIPQHHWPDSQPLSEM